MTPFSAQASIVADTEGWNGGEDLVRVSILLSTDEGPAREFRSSLSVDLDETQATGLLAELSVAIDGLRRSRG